MSNEHLLKEHTLLLGKIFKKELKHHVGNSEQKIVAFVKEIFRVNNQSYSSGGAKSLSRDKVSIIESKLNPNSKFFTELVNKIEFLEDYSPLKSLK
jgi:hypothetical protein